MRAKDHTGLLGEDIAADFLIGLGYRVLERRWRTSRGELDLVVEDGRCLVAVEVKARRGRGFGHPLESIDQQKLRRLHLLVNEYAAQRRSWAAGCRVDVVSVVLGPGSLDGVIAPDVEHLQDVTL
jgi:putative endonuclease